MKEIRGDAKMIRELLCGNKYAIGYYQGDYAENCLITMDKIF
jgi:hypothetical protein